MATFPFTSASLRSLRLEQELQDWEDQRRRSSLRRARARDPVPAAAPRRPPARGVQEVSAGPPLVRCRDTSVHETFMRGDMKGVYALLKEPAMVHALMETVHEEMVWTPEMGVFTLSSKVRHSSALRLAAGQGHSSCVEELLSRGAEVDACPGGNTALHDACSGGHDQCLQLLLSHQSDPELLDRDGRAGLHLCSYAHSESCARLLLDSGADVDVRTRGSRLTALHVAAREGAVALVELLLSRGADVKATSEEGETALNAACSRAERPAEAGRYLSVVQKLLDAGADPRTAGKKRHTPLHNACANCVPRIVELLLKHGARANAQNCAGLTPMDCLVQVVEDFPDQEPENVARFLLNHGAKPVPPEMLSRCVLSPATIEVLLNSSVSVPRCDWLDSLPQHTFQADPDFFEVLRRLQDQPRSLQHLCRCVVRRILGARVGVCVTALNAPRSVQEYLLLRPEGALK